MQKKNCRSGKEKEMKCVKGGRKDGSKKKEGKIPEPRHTYIQPDTHLTDRENKSRTKKN